MEQLVGTSLSENSVGQRFHQPYFPLVPRSRRVGLPPKLHVVTPSYCQKNNITIQTPVRIICAFTRITATTKKKHPDPEMSDYRQNYLRLPRITATKQPLTFFLRVIPKKCGKVTASGASRRRKYRGIPIEMCGFSE